MIERAYRVGGQPPWPGSKASTPMALNRATSRATASPDRRPAARAAAVKLAPAATASNALARATRSARSLLARATRSNTVRSAAVSGRNGSFCRRAMAYPQHQPPGRNESIPHPAFKGANHAN